MVNIERATGAARFVNGDWSEIDLVMPTVTRLVTATGWSTFVMSKFLLLCQRAGTAYPLEPFHPTVRAILAKLDNAKGNWVKTAFRREQQWWCNGSPTPISRYSPIRLRVCCGFSTR